MSERHEVPAPPARPRPSAAIDAPGDHVYRELVDAIDDYAIAILDLDGTIRSWNAGAERTSGVSREAIIGRSGAVFYPAEVGGPARFVEVLRAAAQAGRCVDEGWRQRADGTRFWARLEMIALRDATGALAGYGAIGRDLTGRRLVEDARAVVEERFRLLVDSIEDYAVFMLDPEGRVATWNSGGERIKGYRADEIIGQHFSRFYPEAEVRAGVCDHELASAARDGRFEAEGWRLRRDGSRFWANVVLGAVRDRSGALVGFSKITRDLTERRRVEAEAAARRAAEQANRTKDEFLATLGHELRNPLAPIVSALELIHTRGDVGAAREHEIIARQVSHLTRLVDDLLDVSRIAGGKLELHRAQLDLRDAIGKAVEIAGPVLEQRGHRLAVSAPREPLRVLADEARLVQVFGNLLTNAARYTPVGGHVAVTAYADHGEVAVEVVDDGNGIEPALLPRIFDRFVQGAAGDGGGGLGLGLTLVRSLVELHGGTVVARSAGAGRGSVFAVRLPAAPAAVAAAAPASPRRPAASARSLRILLVDDNDDARRVLAELLAALGHDARGAADAPEALAVAAGFAPEVAVLDLGLPGMDGYALAAALRARLAPAPHLVALTGYGQPSDRARSAAAGFARHLVKPIDARALLAAIDALVGAAREEPA